MATNNEIIEKLDLMQVDIDTIGERTRSNERALRGHNGDVGLVALVNGNAESIGELVKKMDATHALLYGDGKDAVLEITAALREA